MASSESEGFESADEEIFDEPVCENLSSHSTKEDTKEVTTQDDIKSPLLVKDTRACIKPIEPNVLGNQKPTKGPLKLGTKKHNSDASIERKEKEKIEASLRDSTVENVLISEHSRFEGWDFEDEDGFEIPNQLGTKGKEISPSDNSSHPNNMDQKESPGGWSKGWGSWDVTSILSTATESVSNLSRISTGITSALGNGLEGLIETSLGAPHPSQLAQSLKQEEANSETPETSSTQSVNAGGELFGLSTIIDNMSTISTKVISGGLDTLENLGKKTMEVLQEGDPGFKKKRALIFQSDKPVLSQVLRDAKAKGEAIEKEKERDETVRKAQFETLFDDFCGMVHLEALEMISKQCELKVQLLKGELTEGSDDYREINETLEGVRSLFDLPSTDENNKITSEKLKELLDTALVSLDVNVSLDKIEISSFPDLNIDEGVSYLHKSAITNLAEFSAAAMGVFHRIAELLIVKEHHSTSAESEGLINLVTVFKSRVLDIAEYYSKLLTVDPSSSALVTNIFLEACNSADYLENAFELFVPILQLGAVS